MMYWTASGEVVIMVLLGGSGYAWGAIVGAVALTFLRQYISGATDYYELALGVTLVVVVLLMPTGLGGFAKTLTGGLRQRMGTRVIAAD
jgi:branched-chain amino acid transport system permease protein